MDEQSPVEWVTDVKERPIQEGSYNGKQKIEPHKIALQK
jgi:hypothetical protein